eukprot:365908-Chlamydomonas_euryale.AAC.5
MPHYTAIPALNRTFHARPNISAAFPGSHSLRAPFGSSSADFEPEAVPKTCAPYGRQHTMHAGNTLCIMHACRHACMPACKALTMYAEASEAVYIGRDGCRLWLAYTSASVGAYISRLCVD